MPDLLLSPDRVAAALKSRLKELDLNGSQVARRTGVLHQTTVSEMLRGGSHTLRNLELVLEVLDWTFDELVIWIAENEGVALPPRYSRRVSVTGTERPRSRKELVRQARRAMDHFMDLQEKLFGEDD